MVSIVARLAVAGIFIGMVFPAVRASGASGGPRTTRTIDLTIAVPTARVALVADVADLHVTGVPVAAGTPGGTIVVHGTVTGPKEAVDAFAVGDARDGDATVVSFGRERSGSMRDLTATFAVSVPREKPLAARVGSGNVDVRHLASDATLRAGSGDADIADVGGTVTVRDGSGNVSIVDVRGTVDAHAASGTIVARNVRSTTILRSASGDVRATLDRAWSGTAVTLETSSGNVDLGVPPGFRGTVDANTGSGEIRGTAAIAAGGADGVPVRLRSGSGDITIR